MIIGGRSVQLSEYLGAELSKTLAGYFSALRTIFARAARSSWNGSNTLGRERS